MTTLSPSTQPTTTTTTTTSAAQKLNQRDFATFNRLADEMVFYHSHLKKSWDALYSASAPSSTVPASQLVQVGLHFCRHLKTHHDIEESQWFPILAKKMPGFETGGFAKSQHLEIHDGLDDVWKYLAAVRKGEEDLKRAEVRRIMDSFGDVLWTHMGEEVEALRAENMSKYWTLEDMKRLPF